MAQRMRSAAQLQWMQRSPVAGSRSNLDFDSVDARTDDFARPTSTQTHYRVLDEEDQEQERRVIAEAVARLSKKRQNLVKAWGAPRAHEADWQRSLTPRASRSPDRRRRPPQHWNEREVPDLTLAPEHDAESRPITSAGSKRRPAPRKSGTPQTAEGLPSDFLGKVRTMRSEKVAGYEALEEDYAQEALHRQSSLAAASPGAKEGGTSTSRVARWANGIRDAFVDKESKDPHAGRTRRKKRVTKPKPFAGVEARSIVKKVSKSMERTMRELQQKQEEEERALNYRWKAKPIPASTREKRYEALVNKSLAIRIQNVSARRERLKETQRPFRGMEQRDKERARRRKKQEEREKERLRKSQAEARRHKNKRIQAYKASAAQAARANENSSAEAVTRRARIQRRAAKLMHEASMPPRMEMWQKTKAARGPQPEKEENQGGTQSRSGLSKMSKKSAAEIKHTFERSHAQFRKSLQDAKQARSTTVPQPFAFMSRERIAEDAERKRRTEERILRQIEEDRLAKTAKQRRMKDLASRAKKSAQHMPRQTKKTRAYEQKVKQRIKQREDQARKRQNDQAERDVKARKSARKFTEIIQQTVVANKTATSSKSVKEATAEKRRLHLRKSKEYFANLKGKLEKAVEGRRMLFDQHRIAERKREARRAALEKIGAAVFAAPEAKTAAENSSWRQAARRDETRIFEENERQTLDLYDDDDYEDDDDFAPGAGKKTE